MVGGDFQFGPAVMAIAGFALKMHAMVVSTKDSVGTCKKSAVGHGSDRLLRRQKVPKEALAAV